MSVIVTFRPHRACNLLAYMALIIRTAKRFGGRAWSQYDRAFRHEVEVNNLQDWSVMRTDLYNFHTAAINRVPDAQLFNSCRTNVGSTWAMPDAEPIGNQTSPQFCMSWNEGSCVAPRVSCRFRHACNICVCGKPHRQIDHWAFQSRDRQILPNALAKY